MHFGGFRGGRFAGRPRKRCGGLRTDPGAGPRGPLRVVDSRRTPHSLICRPHRPPAATQRPASWLGPEPLQERFSSFPPTRGPSRAPVHARARGSSRPNKAKRAQTGPSRCPRLTRNVSQPNKTGLIAENPVPRMKTLLRPQIWGLRPFRGYLRYTFLLTNLSGRKKYTFFNLCVC